MKTLWEWSKEIREWRREKDFNTPGSLETERERDEMLGKLMLVVSEVSEAAEAVRHFEGCDYGPFYEEISDVFIRLFDICGSLGVDIEPVIQSKMEKNKKRPIRHGKKCSL